LKTHVSCITDPPGVVLYMQTGTRNVGGISLPVYRCARGTTSLECFHNHVKNFVPGFSASLEHMQGYLLEGITRWNFKRSMAYNDWTTSEFVDLSMYPHDRRLGDTLATLRNVPYVFPVSPYTGELVGVDYLLNQSVDDGGIQQTLLDFESSDPQTKSTTCEGAGGADTDGADTDGTDSDEEFENEADYEHADMSNCDEDNAADSYFNVRVFDNEDETGNAVLTQCPSIPTEALTTIPQPVPNQVFNISAHAQDLEETEDIDDIEPDNTTTDANGKSGLDKVGDLVDLLFQFSDNLSMPDAIMKNVITLYDKLDSFDKKPVKFKRPKAHKKARKVSSIYKNPKSSSGIPLRSYKHLLAMGSGPLPQKPRKSRIVEGILHKLMLDTAPSGEQTESGRRSQHRMVMNKYQNLRRITSQSDIFTKTSPSFTLFNTNLHMIQAWQNEKNRSQEQQESRQTCQGNSSTTPVISAKALDSHNRPLQTIHMTPVKTPVPANVSRKRKKRTPVSGPDDAAPHSKKAKVRIRDPEYYRLYRLKKKHTDICEKKHPNKTWLQYLEYLGLTATSDLPSIPKEKGAKNSNFTTLEKKMKKCASNKYYRNASK
jgi:hypothetical protein